MREKAEIWSLRLGLAYEFQYYRANERTESRGGFEYDERHWGQGRFLLVGTNTGDREWTVNSSSFGACPQWELC